MKNCLSISSRFASSGESPPAYACRFEAKAIRDPSGE
jgi:hypothetical protein